MIILPHWFYIPEIFSFILKQSLKEYININIALFILDNYFLIFTIERHYPFKLNSAMISSVSSKPLIL